MRRSKEKAAKLREIAKDMILAGMPSAEIEDATGFCARTVSRLRKELGVGRPTHRYSEQEIQIVREMWYGGASEDEIAATLRRSRASLRDFRSRNRLVRYPRADLRAVLDNLLDSGEVQIVTLPSGTRLAVLSDKLSVMARNLNLTPTVLRRALDRLGTRGVFVEKDEGKGRRSDPSELAARASDYFHGLANRFGEEAVHHIRTRLRDGEAAATIVADLGLNLSVATLEQQHRWAEGV